MKSLASELKSEREKRKIPLAQIAEETRIGLRHLQSIEEGRYSDLPGGIYNRAFLKAYCDFIGLDSEAMIRRYEAEFSPPEKSIAPPARLPSRTFIWFNPVFAWSLMLIISATGLFLSREWISSVFSPYFSHSTISAFRHDSAARTAPEFTREQTATFSKSSNDSTESPATGPEITEANLETDLSSSDSAPTLRVEFEVTEKCWISVDSDGGPVISKLLEPGEAESFDASEQFFIIIGNAGGVHLRINGRPAKPLGKPGEVVKMLINSQNLPKLIKQTTG